MKTAPIVRYIYVQRAFAGMNVGAFLTGLGAGGRSGITLNVILSVILMIMLRVGKFWIDDEAYLDDVSNNILPAGLPFAFGVAVAVVSWILWSIAGIFAKDLELSCLLLSVSTVLNTVWIVAAMVKRGAYAEQVPWLFFNSFYVLGLLLISLRAGQWNPFAAKAEAFTTVVILCLFVVFLFDLVITRLLEQRRRAGTT